MSSLRKERFELVVRKETELMKPLSLVLGAILSMVALSPVTAASEINGVLTRSSRFDSAKNTGCRTASLNRSNRLLYVDMAAFLDTNGGRIDVRPPQFANCNRRQHSHYTTLTTICWDGWTYDRTQIGDAATDADISHDCRRRQGGNGASWYLHVYSGS